ncbi:MAG: PRC-barrel domain-containing protein [Pseudotabrizicola sp.]|uniref:PRC-barrel domain-containing protein n=1 Tax=Pseudotabrizicola sp. TaxID=2939647 RepID=UPI0027185FCF|nr:PRC-barrel domain-containing protein [Pseudotabrizicola sp.]MDO9639562.1 PRC-barrel domain-containing protein [Pseudotabrizicola sp.]
MKKLFGTTALVMALAMPAFAQDTTLPADGTTAPAGTTMDGTTAPAGTMDGTAGMGGTAGMDATSPYFAGIDQGVRASDFIGKTVYVTEQDTSTMPLDALSTADAQWQNAGDISDLIISMNGDAQAVLVDFGGFLGIGQKTVALSLDNLVMVPDSNSADDYFIVFHGTQAELEAAPEFDENMVFAAQPVNDGTLTNDGMGTTGMGTTDPALNDPAMAPAAGGTAGSAVVDPNVTDPALAPADGTGTAATDMPSTGMAGGEMADLSVMTETDLIGQRVVGPNDEDVGEVSSVAIGADGVITGAVVDVGGFLGMGEKRVSLGADALNVVRGADGSVDHFRVTMTQEQLEALPAYEM